MARTGPSGRALSVALEGTAGGRTLTGVEFARALGLRSTRFAASLGTGDAAPAPPPAALQVPPEETATAPVVPFGDARSPAEAARQTVSPGRAPTWPEVLMAAALALCLALRRYARAGQ